MKYLEIWRRLHTFQAKYRSISMLVWLFSWLLSVLFIFRRWDDLPLFVVVFVAMSSAALTVLARYEAALDRRIDAGDEAPTWQVSVNGVTVGTLSDVVYASIRRSVFFDARIYVAQLFNLGKVLLRTLDTLFVAIPVGVFWVGLMSFFFTPDTVASFLIEIQKVTPAQIVASMPTMLNVLIVFSVMLIAAAVVTGTNFGFANQFDQACNRGIRCALGCAAEGEIDLFRLDDDKMIRPREVDHVRSAQ